MKITRRKGLQGLLAGAAGAAMPAIVRGEEQDIVIGAPTSSNVVRAARSGARDSATRR